MGYRKEPQEEFAPLAGQKYNDIDVHDMVRGIRVEYGHIDSGYPIAGELKEKMQDIALALGMPRNVVTKCNKQDLLSMYTVALKDIPAARQVAQRIVMRLDDSLFGKPGEQPPAPVTGMDASALKAMMRDVVHEGALQPLQAALDGMDKSLREDMATSQRATLDKALETMRNGMKDAASEAIRSMTPTRLDVSLDAAPPVTLGLVHRDTARIIAALAAGVNVYLHGPAGSGKTTVARKAAEAFKLQFYFAAKVESEYQLLGFKDAKGETVRTQFREAYELGGMFLFDEMDASSSSAVVALNAALANGICPFPDATINRHKDFHCIGAGNTALTGATRQYSGRNQLDAASIDRFAFIEFDYDDDLERAIATNAAWCAYVQSVRAAVKARALNHLVTPRATYDGCKLLAAGMDWDAVASMVVFKGLDADTVTQIKEALKPKDVFKETVAPGTDPIGRNSNPRTTRYVKY